MKIRRILSCILVSAMAVSLLAGCKDNKEDTASVNSNDSVKLWYAYNTENFMKDVEYPELMAQRDSTVRMHTLKNDVETAQLMITPAVDVASFDFQVSDLKNENGDVLSADNFKLYAAWYVEVLESYIQDIYSGYYPDALIPLENYKMRNENFIHAGQNQALWFEASIPETQAPGIYTGTGELDLDGAKYQVPIEVTVYDAALPNANNMPTLFGVWYDYIAQGEGTYSTELANAYYDFLLSKRISPMKADPTYSPTSTMLSRGMEMAVVFSPRGNRIVCLRRY